MKRHLFTVLGGVLLALSLAACGGGTSAMQPGDSTGDGSHDGGVGNQDSVPPVISNPSFSQDIYRIFAGGGCNSVGCHGSGEGNLYMRTVQEAYANLVNITSPASGEIRVIPGDAQASYLVKKLENRQSVGVLMPFGGPPLAANDIQTVRNWIDRGALNN